MITPPRRFSSPRPPFLGLALAVLLSGFLAACSHTTPVHTRAAGHDIAANIEGSHTIESQPAYAIIRGQYGEVRIEAGRVRIANNPWTGIPVDVNVEVTIKQHAIRVTAGRVKIERTVSE